MERKKGGIMKIRVYQDKVGDWRYTLIAKNGEKIAASEGYTEKSNALRAAPKISKIFKVLSKH